MRHYPDTEVTYGVIVTDATSNAELNQKRDFLVRADVDNIVFLSVIPHDMTTRPDWNEIESSFSAFPRRGIAVEPVTMEQVAQLAGSIRVLAAGGATMNTGGPTPVEIAELKEAGYSVHMVSDQNPPLYGWMHTSGASQGDYRQRQPFRTTSKQAWDDCRAYDSGEMPTTPNSDWSNK